MTDSLAESLRDVRRLLESPDELVRAVASGRRKGLPRPDHVKIELRPVLLKDELHLQVSRHDGSRPHTSNVSYSDVAAELDAVFAQPFGNWLVETTGQTVQLRVTKRGQALVHRATASRARRLEHDRVTEHLIPADDPLFGVLGANAAKRRQVDAFLRAVDPSLASIPEEVRVADLGCGNAYLTFALYRHLERTGRDARVVGVDVRDDQRDRNTSLAERLGYADRVRFEAGTIARAPLDAVNLVVALHACDTATDDALARGVAAGASHIVAAPCCHHDIAAQLRTAPTPEPYGALTADGILRERFADVLTDALRASLLRSHGYQVDVIEFIDSSHTPRNTMLRAVYTGTKPSEAQRGEYTRLTETWGVEPRLATLIGPP